MLHQAEDWMSFYDICRAVAMETGDPEGRPFHVAMSDLLGSMLDDGLLLRRENGVPTFRSGLCALRFHLLSRNERLTSPLQQM